jgi:hypothetical protein
MFNDINIFSEYKTAQAVKDSILNKKKTKFNSITFQMGYSCSRARPFCEQFNIVPLMFHIDKG